MCGIMGFIRTAPNTQKTEKVISEIFAGIAIRGFDAAGWGALTPRGPFVEKAPFPSWKLRTWKHFKRIVPESQLFIGHARAATSGSPKVNKNNHPHCTDRLEHIFVHNGVIWGGGHKDHGLSLRTECDSEILLRVIERSRSIKKACKEIEQDWSYGNYAWLDLMPTENAVYAYRDYATPCFYIDLTEQAGGLFLASTDEILEDALDRVFGPRFWDTRSLDSEVLYRFEPYMRKPLTTRIPVRRKSTRTYYNYFDSDTTETTYVKQGGVWVPVTQRKQEQPQEQEYLNISGRPIQAREYKTRLREALREREIELDEELEAYEQRALAAALANGNMAEVQRIQGVQRRRAELEAQEEASLEDLRDYYQGLEEI